MAALLASAAELDIHLQQIIPTPLANLALAGASGAVRGYCGWDLSRETTTLRAVGTGTVLLTLPTLYLDSVTEVRIGGLALNPAGTQPNVLRDGQLVYASTWPAGVEVEVDCTHGFDPIPDVARLVVLTIAARIVNNPDNYKTASVGTVTRTYDPGLTALDERLLARYRLE